MKKLILILLVLFCGCVSHATPPPTIVVTKPVTTKPTAERNLGADFEKLMEKYGVIPKSQCVQWDNTETVQSVLCEVNPQIVVYCVASPGQMPTCKFAVDLRTPPAESKKDEPAPNPPKAPSLKH